MGSILYFGLRDGVDGMGVGIPERSSEKMAARTRAEAFKYRHAKGEGHRRAFLKFLSLTISAFS